MRYDALVIGGGPAGATAAFLLAKAGWSVAIVEKSAFPRRKVCGEFISATSLPLLHELGIGERFSAMAGPEIARVGLFAGEIVASSALPSARNAGSAWGRALGREHLDVMMLDAAARAGAAVWQPWRVTAIERCDSGFSCMLAAQSEVKNVVAPIVIRANGSWERAALLDADRNEHRPADLLAFKAHFRDADLPADLMPLLIFPGGDGGMVRTDDGRLTLSCCIRRDALQRCRRDKSVPNAGDAVLRHIVASSVGVRDTLARARLDGAFLSAGPIRPGIRRRYAGGIFVVGNAAGEAHPIVAEGISMAMQSASLLCRQLIARQDAIMAGAAHHAVGAAYARDWNASFATRTRAAAAFAFLLTRSRAAAPALRLVQSYPGIMTVAARLAGKAKVIAAAA